MIEFPGINGVVVAIVFGLLQGSAIIVLYLFKRKTAKHRYLIMFLATLLFVQLYSFFIASGWMLNFTWLLNSNVPFTLILAPLALFYTYELLGVKIKPGVLILHLLPAVLYFIYSFNFFLQSDAYKFNIINQMIDAGLPARPYTKTFPSDPWDIQGWVVVELISLQLIAYGIYGTGFVSRFKDKISGIQKSWTIFLNIILIGAGITLFLSEGGVVNGYVFFESPFPRFSGDVFSTLALYSMTLYLIFNPDILTVGQKKYSKSSLSTDYIKAKHHQLIKLFDEEKLYLTPGFNLDMLSAESGISKHHISQILNAEVGMSFLDLTNKYRIKEAQEILSESQFIKMEVLANQLGYRSKSSFFNAFKKITNTTPGAYQQSI